MDKKIIKIEIDNEALMEKIKNTIGNQCACFVLITCSAPSAEGKMEVQMHFEGDESLASFLVENAAQVFDDRIGQRESQ